LLDKSTNAGDRRNSLMKILTFLVPIIAWVICPLASAHHGPPTDAAHFYTDRLVEMEAEIVEVFWHNPHVRYKMRVLNDSGEEEEWEMELRRGPRAFANIGLEPDFLKPGEVIKIAGFVSRRKINLIGAMNVLMPDGRELTEANIETRWTDDRLLTDPGRRELDPAALAAAEAAADGIFRPWVNGAWGIPEVPIAEYIDHLSNTAHTLRARFVPARDDPELKCQNGMPFAMFDPPPMEIRRGDDGNIIIHLQEYDIDRTFHMDGGLENPEPSRFGHSVGRWENDSTLVVTTTHVNWPFFDGWGTPQSDQVSYLERFTLSEGEDETRLDYSITADDPVMFVEPVVLERSWRWQPGVQITPYNCTLWEGDTEYDPVASNPFQ
jgi:hypothetical protein